MICFISLQLFVYSPILITSYLLYLVEWKRKKVSISHVYILLFLDANQLVF